MYYVAKLESEKDKMNDSIRNIVVICLVILGPALIGQQLTCPPGGNVSCHLQIQSEPVITDGEGYELEMSRTFEQSTCEESTVVTIFSLVNIEDQLDTADVCTHIVTVLPYLNTPKFPRDTTVFGYAVSEVYNKTIFTEGMVPLAANDCGIFYEYEDEFVELYPDAHVFRHWSAYNSCTDKTSLFRQQIRLRSIPNNTISTSVKDCGGIEVEVSDITIYFNDEVVELGDCFMPFDSLHETLNCLADTLLESDTDFISLVLEDIYNPFIGIGLRDIVDIQRHILGLKRFEEPCRLEAADVNQDGRINGADLVELRKLILGIYTSWPYGNGTSIEVNGVPKESLEFRKSDFPLPSLDITIINKGNTSRNN